VTDRRRHPRGGRRASDQPGSSPLILVADEDSRGRHTCEAILAKLHFAVAPVSSVDEAVGAFNTLRPDLVVAHVADVSKLRSAIWHAGRAADVPLIVVTERMREPKVLLDEIRRALRTRRPV
jgi:DNA-binding response OmpR family regulator